MSREEAIKTLKDLQQNSDVEVAHDRADCVLIALLGELGYEDVVEEWIKVEKWYA